MSLFLLKKGILRDPFYLICFLIQASVCLDAGRKEEFNTAIVISDTEPELDRMVDADLDFYFIGTSHDLAHVLEIIQREQRACLSWNEIDEFILPGGSKASALLHLARTIVRRAERDAVTLARGEDVPGEVLLYLNRVGDALFVLAREITRRAGTGEVKWEKGR